MADPLTKEDLDKINTALDALRGTKQVIERAKASGIDVTVQEARLNESETKLRKIKAGFFPNGVA